MEAKTLETPPNGSLISADSPLAKRAGLLLVRLRALYNQAPLDIEQLKLAGVAWAEELSKAGIPPRRWEEMATLARQWRPSSSKAFMITADQVIDVWQHYGLRGSVWSDGDWRANHGEKFKTCGECRGGYLFLQRELERVDSHGVKIPYDPPQFQEYHAGPCLCRIEFSARKSYFFRRFAAAFDIATGRECDPASDELVTLWQLTREQDRIVYREYSESLTEDDWDEALRAYLATESNPTLGGFCTCEAFAHIYEARRRQEELDRRRQEAAAEQKRISEEQARKRAEEQRNLEEQRRAEWNERYHRMYGRKSEPVEEENRDPYAETELEEPPF